MAVAPAEAATNPNSTIVTNIVRPAAIPKNPAMNPVAHPAAYILKNLFVGVKYLSFTLNFTTSLSSSFF